MQNSLFDTPLPPAVTHAMALVDKPSAGMSKLQKDFIRYANDIEATQSRLVRVKSLAQSQGSKRDAVLSKIENQSMEIKRKTVLFLDERLMDKKGLTANQRKMAARVLCEVAAEVMGTPMGDGIQAIIDRHEVRASAEEDAELALAKQLVAKRLRNAMGLDLDADDLDADPQAMFDQLQQKMQAETEARFVAQEARRAAKHAAKKPTPKQQEAQDKAKALLANREQTLKTIYRKLSSTLHPDRESDEGVRKDKSALMVEANKAYAAKDLFGLLRLQVKAQAYGNVGTAVEDEQLMQINTMLKNQLMDAQAEVREIERSIRASFGLNYGVPVTQETLDFVLKSAVAELLSEVKYMSGQFAKMQTDDKFLKAWLKEMDFGDELVFGF